MTTGLPHGKPAPQRTRRSQQTAKDRAESAKVRKRSGGICEIRIMDVVAVGAHQHYFRPVPCSARASHVHHLLSGIGVRGRGESAKADRKLHLCLRHHQEIHAKRLVLVPSGPLPVYTDCYRLVR